MRLERLDRYITPGGWMKRQLEIQAEGLSGHLDSVWPDIRDSAWLGGDREGWERFPYWLDGFIPMAYLLKNEDMMGRAKKYIHAIIERQNADGWICPCGKEERGHYDVWAAFLIGKVLSVYAEFSEDGEAEKALRRAMKNLWEELSSGRINLFDWGKYRWFEAFIPLIFLYKKKKEDWIIDLAKILRKQGVHYPDLQETWKRPLNKWTFYTHVVNLAMMFKYEAVVCELLGEKPAGDAEKLWRMLQNTNGTAVDTLTGDECLGGIGNNRGTELCSVVELMYACEVIYQLTEEDIWLERLEKIAFNALPATFTDDMWAHQYDQQVNQIACQAFPGKSFFGTNDNEAHLFGLEPHFGCCTANFSQGWPKLCGSAFMKTEDGLLLALLLPTAVSVIVKGVPVTVSADTEYPFRHEAKIRVTAAKNVSFALKIRVPKWARNVKVNGQSAEGTVLTMNQDWCGTTEISLSFEDEPRLVERPGNMRVVEYGPLVFSLPLSAEYTKKEYTRNGVERRYPYCDYELSSQDAWNYGFADGKLEVFRDEISNIPFSSKEPPLKIRTSMTKIAWNYAEGYETVANALPESTVPAGDAEQKTLVPYGCAKLRMTEMPLVKNGTDI